MTLNIWRRKTYFFADEKENEENIWGRIIYFFAEKKKHGEGKKRNISGEGKYIVC